MRPAVVLATLLLLTRSAATAREPQEPGSLSVSMRGCVSGSLLKSVVADSEDEAGSLVWSDRYRMVGTRGGRDHGDRESLLVAGTDAVCLKPLKVAPRAPAANWFLTGTPRPWCGIRR